MVTKNSLILRSATLALLLAVPVNSYAKNGGPEDSPGHNSGGSPSAAASGKFEAKLRGVSGPSHGSLKVERTTKKGVVREARIDVRAEIAPASIADTTSELSVEIRRAGVLVASCLAVFDDIEVEHRVPLAEYKTDVRIKKQGAPTAKSGYCDIDPTTPAVDLGIPTIAIGDTVSVINSANSELLLSGTVGKKRR